MFIVVYRIVTGDSHKNFIQVSFSCFKVFIGIRKIIHKKGLYGRLMVDWYGTQVTKKTDV